jgi:inner membrane protein YidH
MAADRRWPGWVYSGGEEPDARFSFANERTFLAWVRTSLAFLAGGVALDAVDLPMPGSVQRLLAVLLVLLGVVCAAASWLRWARAERAIRHRAPLPSSPLTAVLTVGILCVAVILLFAGI